MIVPIALQFYSVLNFAALLLQSCFITHSDAELNRDLCWHFTALLRLQPEHVVVGVFSSSSKVSYYNFRSLKRQFTKRQNCVLLAKSLCKCVRWIEKKCTCCSLGTVSANAEQLKWWHNSEAHLVQTLSCGTAARHSGEHEWTPQKGMFASSGTTFFHVSLFAISSFYSLAFIYLENTETKLYAL